MTSDRKQPGVAFWATVTVVVLLVAYPLNFGPVSWMADRDSAFVPKIKRAYRPIVWVAQSGPYPVGRLLRLYADWWARPRRRELVVGIFDRWTVQESIIDVLDRADD